MKKLTTLLFFVLCTVISTAQTFNYPGPNVPIPDNNTNVNIPIVVSGLPNQINAAYGLAEVSFSLTHTWVSDLKISLTSPAGNSVVLSLHNGSSGANYTNTV